MATDRSITVKIGFSGLAKSPGYMNCSVTVPENGLRIFANWSCTSTLASFAFACSIWLRHTDVLLAGLMFKQVKRPFGDIITGLRLFQIGLTGQQITTRDCALLE